ncbi:MAG: hypothetical protein JWN79_1038 [Gemmatimonadetes bacterium]|jgi:hypothetical protein|nr:hypothetical protein [Gemmatimonadota bacterium]
MTAVPVLALAVVLALATWGAGWWGVLVVALIAGTLWRRTHGARWCALAAALGWALLLAVDAVSGRFGTLSRGVGGLMRVPPLALVLVTLLFAAAAAWSAAAIGAEVTRMIRNHRRRESVPDTSAMPHGRLPTPRNAADVMGDV